MEIPLEESMRNIILSRISYAQDQINSHEDVHTLIHEIRKTVKRIRAVLKLIRDEIGYSNYYRENSFYRDLGRSLSGVRDSYVLGEVFSSLHERFPDAMKEKDYEAITGTLTRKVERELSDFTEKKGGFDSIHRELDCASGRVEQYCRLRNDFISVEKGIKRIYRRGSRYLSRVRKEFDTAEFHEYRKNTKYLLHQVEIIQPIYPRVLKSYAKSIDKHAELLGETRDYDRLEAYLHDQAGNVIRNAVKSSILGKIENHRGVLLQKIFSKSSLIYAENPKKFVKRLGNYWEAGYGS